MSGGLKGGAARSLQDVVGGLALVLIALLALYLVRDLPASGRVGFASGTAPRIFAYGLLVLGAYVAIAGFFKEGPGIDGFPLRGPIAILGSVLFFAFSIRVFGLAVTGVPMVMLAATATPEGRWKESFLFAVGITAFCALVFPIALGQPIPLWPTFDIILSSPVNEIFSYFIALMYYIISFIYLNIFYIVIIIQLYIAIYYIKKIHVILKSK